MELKYFKTIKTILEEGSFQKAAQKLNYTQSTITFHVNQTEKYLQVKLFEKVGRNMKLTQAGRDLMPSIEMLLDLSKQMKSYYLDTEKMKGELTVAMPESLLSYKMQPVILKFREQAPDVKLSIQALNCYEIRDKVQTGSVDLGIHYDLGGYSDALIVQKLFSFPFAIIASPLLAQKQCKDKARKMTIIYSIRGSIYHQILEEYIKENDIFVDNRIELSSTEAIKKCVAGNLGISVLPRFAVEKELNDRRLVTLKTKLDCQRLTTVYSYRKNRWISPAMSLFIKIVKEYLLES